METKVAERERGEVVKDDYEEVKRGGIGSEKEKQVPGRERETMGGSGGTVPRDRNRVCPLETLNATGK